MAHLLIHAHEYTVLTVILAALFTGAGLFTVLVGSGIILLVAVLVGNLEVRHRRRETGQR